LLLKMTGEKYTVVFPLLAVFCLAGALCIMLARHAKTKAD